MSTQGKKPDFVARKWGQLLACFFLLLGTSACDLINPEEEIPSYIWIAPFEVQTRQCLGQNYRGMGER